MDRLRPRTVPQGYSYHHWKSGRYENSMECMVNINFLFHLYFIDEDEGLVEKLRSIVAQLEYSQEIKEWDKKGIPFSRFFYVPEVHPETSQHFWNEKMKLMCLRYFFYRPLYYPSIFIIKSSL